jgi:hypothetical protein
MTGELLDSDGERVERELLRKDDPLLFIEDTDGRLCQAGGGLSGSPDNCLWRLLGGLTGEVGKRVLFDLFGDFGDKERERESSYGFSRSLVGEGD